jgi:hypothetical protein
MPVFSRAISPMVSPRYFWWSSDMSAITEISGSTTLVASKRPPIPTSSTAISIPTLAKYSNAITVSISKKLGCQGSLAERSRSCAVRSTRSYISLNSGSEMASPLTRIRSLMVTRCGEL